MKGKLALPVGMFGVVCGLLSIAGTAVAQPAAPGSPGAPPQRQERPDERPPSARAAENYDPKGVQIGSFKLFPELELDQIYNDNIYAVQGAGTGAFIEQIKPTLDLRSDWNVHMLNAYAKGGIGFYSIDPGLNNFQDVSVGADGRFDIQRDWNVYGGTSWNRRHEERGAPNTVTGANFPITIYNQIIANAGYFQKFNRLSVRADGRFDNFIYFDNGLNPSVGVIPNSQRDRNEYREALRVGYEMFPGYEFWVRGGLNQRSYFQLSNGVDRSSYGYNIVGGVLFDLGGITSIEAFAGYMQQTFYSGVFQNVSAPTFGLTGYWNPIRELWVKPYVQRSVDDSSLTTSAAFINTSSGLDVTYNMRPNIRLDAHADYSIADYLAVAGVPGNRYDQYWTFRVGGVYFPTPNFFIGPSYQFITRNSNQPNSNFNQNLLMLRLGTRI